MDWSNLTEWWRLLTTTDWWNLVTTLVGAIIGATVSYVIARQAAKESRAAQRQERLDRDRGAAQALTVKLMRLVNSLAGYRHQTETSISEADKSIPDSPLWAKMLPLVGSENALVHFEPSEWAILVAAKDLDFLNRAIMLSDRYNNLVHAYRSYSAERVRFTEQFGAMMEGKIGTTLLTQGEKERLEPRAIALEDHAKAVRDLTNELFDEARDLAPRFGPIVRAYLKDPTFPVLTLPTTESAKTPAERAA